MSLNWTALGVLLALITTAGNAIYSIAVINTKYENLERGYEQLQEENRKLVPIIQRMDVSLARVETKLEILVPTSNGSAAQ